MESQGERVQVNKKEVSAQYRAEKAAFDGKRKAVKLCSIAKKRVSALSSYEDKQILKGLGLL